MSTSADGINNNKLFVEITVILFYINKEQSIDTDFHWKLLQKTVRRKKMLSRQVAIFLHINKSKGIRNYSASLVPFRVISSEHQFRSVPGAHKYFYLVYRCKQQSLKFKTFIRNMICETTVHVLFFNLKTVHFCDVASRRRAEQCGIG